MAGPAESAQRIYRSAGVVSAAILLSRITGLVRESVMGRLFGAGAINDAFVLAFRIPNLTRDLFAEGALSSAFVPLFTKYLTTKGKDEARELSNLVATALMAIVGAFCVLGMIFSPQLVDLFASAFRKVPGKFELAVSLTRIMFPFLLLVALAAQAMGILNATNRFGVPALSSTFFNIGSVIFGLLLGYVLGPWTGLDPIHGMAFGVVLGGALQLLSQVPTLVRAGFGFRPAIDFSHPGLRNILQLMGPAFLGNASVQINVLVNTNYAAGITDAAGHVMNGPVSWLGYAFRFMQLPLGLFGVAIASATLPSISRSAAVENIAEFRHTLSRSLVMVMLLTVPSAAGLAILGDSMIGVVYQGGRFHASDTPQTALALSCYAVGLTGYAALKVLVPAFYALNDARSPMLISVLSIGINFAVASAMVKLAGLGHAGLALSTSTVALAGFAALLAIMRRRIGGIDGKLLLSRFLRIGAATLAMSAVCAASSHLIRAALGVSFATRILDLTISIPLGAAVFYAACRRLRIPELDVVMEAVAGPLFGRIRRKTAF
jgi:putative peptidoglycan lipid II flippase